MNKKITPSDLRAEAQRLIAEGKMPKLDQLLGAVAFARQKYGDKIKEARLDVTRQTALKVARVMREPLREPPLRESPTGNPIRDWLESKNIPYTWDNWLTMAWGENALTNPRDALRAGEALADVPEEFQDEIELFLQDSATGSVQ